MLTHLYTYINYRDLVKKIKTQSVMDGAYRKSQHHI